MSSVLLVALILLVGCSTSAYVTTHICHDVFESSWQEITYAGGSVEPKEIYICKNCNYQADDNYNYCSNCGSKMINGKTRIYYSNKLKISE